jgi:aryl-alcohol dehydrogenase-like predicted oxidoreductase
MRLSTVQERDDASSLAVLTAALDAGVDLLDSADAYALHDADVGHNERLLARACAGRTVEIVTKGGLVRPDGAWLPNGRAKHLAAAARASRDRLGRQIDLYLLHAVDPRTPLSTSVRALAKLRDDGITRAVGLSNITRTQLEEALAITPIDAIEVELHPWKLDAVRGGLVALCEQQGIRLLAHRPLGGPPGAKRIARDAVIDGLAQQLGVTAHEVVLAWLRSLSPVIVPLPGATRVETAVAAGRAAHLFLDERARHALAVRFLEVGTAPVRGERASGELVVIVGMQGSGKSTLAEDYIQRGFVRLNRDERGGSLTDLARAVDEAIAGGADRIVLDNTYASRASRAPLVAIANKHGMTIRCIAVSTPLEQAQSNAVARMLARHGRLLEPAELGARGEIAPNVQFRYRREYEPPRTDEGFASIEEIRAPRRITGNARGIIVELDGIVWKGRPRAPADIEVLPGALALRGWSIVGGTTWQPGATAAQLAALGEDLRARLGLDIALLACTHPAGPPICWCRKPLPGLALQLAHAKDLDLSKTLHLGRAPADRGFALRAGMPYVEISAGWPSPEDPLPLPADP